MDDQTELLTAIRDILTRIEQMMEELKEERAAPPEKAKSSK